MGRLFDIKEIDGVERSLISEDFLVSEHTPSNYNIFRLIKGEIEIINNDTFESCESTVNYLGLYYEYDSTKSFENNLSEILHDSIDKEDLKIFFFDRRYALKNTAFFKRLENEFCNFLSYQEKGNYTTAFIFIYRILELISFSFPLIYASRTYDFKHSYVELSKMFESNTGSKKGELGFLKSAINIIFKDRDFANTSIDILLEDEDSKNKKVFNAIRSVSDDTFFHEDTIENSKICIRFCEVSSFIITLRNRFFHLFNRGDRNLESIDIIDPDYFFSQINQALFSWICVLYIEINKFLLDEYVKTKQS